MQRYFGVVHQEGDSAFGIHFPDVPGCFSAADNQEDLIAKAIEALSLHLEGEELPHARSFHEIKSDPEVRHDLEAGGVLIMVPFYRMTGKTVRANLTIDAGLLSAVDQQAKSRGLTRSAFLADLARRELNQA